ncbi:MAG TPA: aminotransferase class IV [Bryobacteraceae bacterium]|nr:aminotransferase class IV [Bryobacteraceae bacterium]
MHRFVLHNDDIREASSPLLAPGQVGLLAGWGVFSTIRVIDGVLFAFEHHWARMSKDAAALGVTLPPDPETVRRGLLALVDANQAFNATLRVVVVRNKGGIWEGPAMDRASDLIALTTAIKEWGSGVRLCYTPRARYAAGEFAGAKILAWGANLTWLERAQRRGFDETILLNENGEVAECTSANLFVARGNDVWTPPLNSGCLPGVTRDLLLHQIEVPQYRVRERALTPQNLEDADEVFITSTTRNLLPVVEIEGRAIPHSGPACAALQSAFSAYLNRYVAAHKDVSTVPL